MSCYRAFLLDNNGRIFRAKQLYCRDDRAALALGGKIRTRCCGVEVWDGRRMVGSVSPRKREADASTAWPRWPFSDSLPCPQASHTGHPSFG